MTLGDINRWLETEGRDCESAGFSPEQAVAVCRWKLSDKVDDFSTTMMMPLFANCCEVGDEEIP